MCYIEPPIYPKPFEPRTSLTPNEYFYPDGWPSPVAPLPYYPNPTPALDLSARLAALELEIQTLKLKSEDAIYKAYQDGWNDGYNAAYDKYLFARTGTD